MVPLFSFMRVELSQWKFSSPAVMQINPTLQIPYSQSLLVMVDVMDPLRSPPLLPFTPIHSIILWKGGFPALALQHFIFPRSPPTQ